VEDLSGHLARGSSVGAALAAARRERIRTGAPTASWAGLVALGDVDVVPFPGGRRPSAPPWLWLPSALALIAIALLVARRLRR
jgi:hypothetical protein